MSLEYLPQWAWVVFRWLMLITLLLPFIPGLIEIFRKKDVKPLHIDQNFVKDPFFFTKIFVSKLKAALPVISHGKHTITMNKLEDLEITNGEVSVERGLKLDHIVYSTGGFKTSKGVKFSKEIYVKGSAEIGENNVLRAIAADGNLKLGAGTIVIRWIGSKANIIGPDYGFLGSNAVAEESVVLPQGCVFKTIYAKPIISIRSNKSLLKKGPGRYDPEFLKEIMKPKMSGGSAFLVLRKKYIIIGDGMEVSGGYHTNRDLELGIGCHVEGNVVSGGNISVRRDAVIAGDVTAKGSVRIGANATVTGRVFSLNNVYLEDGVKFARGEKGSDIVARNNLFISSNCLIEGSIKAGEQVYISSDVDVHGSAFCERHIILKENVSVYGNLFAQGAIYIEGRSTIGKDGGVKSVIAKKGVYLQPNVIIYGQVATEGEGVVV